MLVTNAEARNKYCPFKFSHPADAKAGRTNSAWICEGPKCMAWQKKTIPAADEGGYCGLTENPVEHPNR
jgi:hypothetical protein